MARITVEDCLKQIPNHFALVVVAAKRARDRIKKEQKQIFEGGHKGPVSGLLDVASGKVVISGGTLEQHIRSALNHATGELKTIPMDEVVV